MEDWKENTMEKKHMNLFFPQWQGAGKSKELLNGALEIKEKYMDASQFIEIPVSDEDIYKVENNILGYDEILQQLQTAKRIVSEEAPDCIFTVGGGCDVEIIPVSYLNDKLRGDLTVLWIDAHGDLNTPESSPSKCFHGMPLRLLLGDGDQQILETAFSKLSTSQLLMMGQRDLDEPEKDFIKKHNMDLLTTDELNITLKNAIKAIQAKGSNNIYVHINLDILDNVEFPYVMVPSPGGLKS